MVEETDVLLHERDAQLLGRLENRDVVLAASRGGDVLDARAGGTVDVVDEGELVVWLAIKSTKRQRKG
jgi:hypothetical protein